MPTLLRVGPYRFFCYVGDYNEPPHIHIEPDADEAKFWLDPIRLQSNRRFSRTEISRIQKLIQENQAQLLAGWNDFFND
ncbi:DUF4160 domain-containing protein [Thermosynechococcaceae cyanobacterium BACA0444]|uniref:DUF4160 domain-containing protein n=1 Tax=Pseudocalidococcus azoricus BACA0444 TaxID=2918990 RepID=A0AAE4FU46_9CYAN|nr:DUF4160 domain-containing protein [Pseudocalidococcus azoricus]MDS3862295.1 DUF4160 domain-containing protein [Pseudocalidococcus azoricus BACA0444]